MHVHEIIVESCKSILFYFKAYRLAIDFFPIRFSQWDRLIWRNISKRDVDYRLEWPSGYVYELKSWKRWVWVSSLMAANRVKENTDFILCVREHPALWDLAHHLHSDRLVCDALWEYIGNKFKTNGKSRIWMIR